MQIGTVVGLAAIALAAGSFGCVPQDEIELNGTMEFRTDTLRPNLEPFAEIPEVPPYYSDGNSYSYDPATGRSTRGTLDSARVSELIISEQRGRDLADLRRARCLWVSEGQRPVVSYELVLSDFELDGESFAEVSMCQILGDPFERESIVDDDFGGGFILGPGLGAELVAYHGSGGDPKRPCEEPIDVDDDGLTDFGNPDYDPFSWDPTAEDDALWLAALQADFQHPNSDPPGCVILGVTPPVTEDTSFLLQTQTPNQGEVILYHPEGEVRRAGGGDMLAIPKLLEPRLQVVPNTGSFRIARPLYLEGTVTADESETTRERRQVWRWSVPILEDGQWHENFAFDLSVNEVRVFRETGDLDELGDPAREYLTPSRVRAFKEDRRESTERVYKCDRELDDPGDGPGNCIPSQSLTPSYAHADPRRWLSWVVNFRAIELRVPCVDLPDPIHPGGGASSWSPHTTADCGYVVESGFRDPDAPLFVEFELNPAPGSTGGSAVGLTPITGGSFGDVVLGDRPRLPNALTIVNDDIAHAEVQGLWIDGPDANVFGVSVAGGLTAPFIVQSETEIDLALEAFSTAAGPREASLHVQGVDTRGASFHHVAPLSANGVDWRFEALPESLALVRGASASGGGDATRSLLLINGGHIDMPRAAITIDGPGADSFSVVAPERASPDPSLPPYDPATNGEPPPGWATIAPGSDEWLVAVYHPSDAYRPSLEMDEATIRVEIGDTIHAIEIRGWCQGACAFDAPVPASPAAP